MDLSDYELQRVITSWLQVSAVLVAAASLMISMARNRLKSKMTITSVANEGLVKFVEISAKYPHLYLLEPENRPSPDLSYEDREIERSAYLLLLLTYERMYQYASATGQRAKLKEFDRLIAAYSPVDQFRQSSMLIASISGPGFASQLENLLGSASDDPGADQ